jgi:hypothetical protein
MAGPIKRGVFENNRPPHRKTDYCFIGKRFDLSSPPRHKGAKFFFFTFPSFFCFVPCLPLQAVGRGCLCGVK